MASNIQPARRTVAGHRHGQVPRAVREQQLLDLAERIFVERGYAGFSIEDLTRAAGVSRPIVYEHFGSKDGIYLACLRRIRGEFEQALMAAVSDAPDIATALERGGEAFFSTLESEPRRWSVVHGGTGALVGPLSEELTDMRFATVERIAEVVRLHKPAADAERVEAFAHAISGAGEQLGRWWLRNPDMPRARVVAHYRDVCAFAAQALVAKKAGS